MKKIYLVLLLSCMSFAGFSQTAASYNFAAITGAFHTISGTGTSTTRISYDDSTLQFIPLGFTFNYCGTSYTSLSACSNGWLSFANASSATSFTTWAASFSNSTSSLSSLSSGTGFLMPYWDDLWGSGHTAYYQTSGAAPFRKFTFEWSNWALYLDYVHYANFQVILYETTNQIDFVYGASAYPSRSATIGIANSSTDYKVLSAPSASPTASSSTFTTTIPTFPANGQVYRFNPPAAACSGTPSAGSAVATPVTACDSSSVNLSLTGYTLLSGVTYQWQRSTDNSTWSNIAGATNLYSSTIQTTDMYYRCNVRCTASSVTSPSTSVFVPYSTGCYCIPSYTRAYASCDSLGMAISRFNVNGTAGTTINDVAHCTGTGYFDRTSLSVSLIDGTSYTATISGSVSYRMNAQAWIDFNDDFTFQSSESVGGLNNYLTGGSFALAIPSSSALGTHRMRVVTVDSLTAPAYPSINPCAGYSLGDARDYTVIIYPLCTGTPAAGVASTSASPVCTGAPFTVSITGYTIAGGITFQWQSSSDNATWSNLSGATDANYTTIHAAATYYRCLVTCTTVSVTTPSSSVLVNYLSSCYCTPSFTSPCGTTSIAALYMTGAASTTLNDPSTCTGSYSDRTSLSVSLIQGSSTIIYISSYSTLQNSQAWIDFDNDGTFQTSESVGGQNSFSLSAAYNISIPSGSALGIHRMRVLTNRSADGHTYSSMNPCAGSGYVGGEARDYTVNILANNCSGTPSAGAVSVSASTSCSSFTPTLTAVGYTTAPFTYYRWQSSTDSTSWTYVTGATGSTLTPTISSGTIYYRFVDSCSSSGLVGYSAGVRLFVNTVPSVTAITGADSICEGSSLAYTDTTLGGTWSVTNPALATINSFGVVTGIAPGTDTIRYAVTNVCGTTTVSKIIVINPTPVSGIIGGLPSVCENDSITFTSSATGGSWSASNANATVSAAGVVTGVTAGSDTIYYTVTNSCGTSVSSRVVNINVAPHAGTISGPSSVCVAASITLSSTTIGGSWSTTTGNASNLGSSINGVSAGADTVVYSFTNGCGTDVSRHPIVVNPLPNAGSISGPASVCPGASITFSASDTGGTWGLTNTRASISGDTVTGVTAGVDTVLYMITNTCGTDTATQAVVINPAPAAGSITGASSVCEMASTMLSASVPGGSWSASNSNASVSLGLVTGNTAGVDTITYSVTNGCGTATTTKIITVNPLPNPGTISGATSSVCVGSSISFTTTGATGGSWNSSTALVSVTSSGIVTGVTAGTTILSYTITNSCGTLSDTVLLTVNPNPVAGTLSGATTVCQGASTTIASSVTGGSWTASNANASVTASGGTVTGVTPGIDTIYYSVTNVCGTATAMRVMTINPLPSASAITSSTTSICVGATTTYSNAIAGGSWSSGSTVIATVSTAGVVYGRAAGTTYISYSVTNSCGTGVAVLPITVNPVPTGGTITGPSSVCLASIVTLANPTGTGGGAWSSTNPTVATVDATGNVFGNAVGTATISYLVTTAICGSAFATASIVVNPIPYAGSISGPTSVCRTSTITLTNTGGSAGGGWTSSAPGIAAVGATTGIVTGVTPGTATITYTASTASCGTAIATYSVTVNALPIAGTITGATTFCEAATSTLANPSGTSGGTWTSSNTSIASINSSGVMSGVAPGTAVITYTANTASCGSAFTSATVTVNPLPFAGTITGTTSLCPSTSTVLTASVSGGTWASTNVHTSHAGGTVYGITAGTDTIGYSVTNSCGTAVARVVVTVYPVPTASAIAGPTSVCAGSSATLTDAIAGGRWTVSSGLASIDTSTGVITGITAGSLITTYTVSNYCGSSFVIRSFTVNPLSTPAVSLSIMPGTNVCVGDLVTFTAVPTSGGTLPIFTWKNFGTPVGSGPTYTYSPSTGDAISCEMLSNASCIATSTAVSATSVMTVNPVLTPSISIVSVTGDTVRSGQVVNFTANVINGGTFPAFQWFVNGGVVAGATNATYSQPFFHNQTVYCELTSNAPCVTVAKAMSNVYTIIVRGVGLANIASSLSSLALYPNPNAGSFTVKANADDAVTFQVVDVLGKVIYTGNAAPQHGVVEAQIVLGNDIAPGQYILKAMTANGAEFLHFVKE